MAKQRSEHQYKRWTDLVSPFRPPVAALELKGALTFLSRALMQPALSRGAQELLLQGLVLTWSAFEVAARDTFVTLLNARPALASHLAADDAVKRSVDFRFTIDSLSEYGYNLASAMGTVLASRYDMSGWLQIKRVFAVLFRTTTLLLRSLQPLNFDSWLLVAI